MALTRKEFIGNGSTTLINVDFDLGYIDKDYVYVYLASNEPNDQLSYTWRNSNQIELTSPVDNDVKFYVRRMIPRDQLVNDYEDGAILREGNLNDSYLQTLMILEEVQDGFITIDDEFLILAKIVISQNLDMKGFNIENLGEASSASEATTLAQVNKLIKAASNLDVYTEELIDYITLKIFQSPTDGGLTKIQTRTVGEGEVYEVRKTSDDSLATIYSDVAGTTVIVQSGTINISDSAGVVEFYIAIGDYYITSGTFSSDFAIGTHATGVNFDDVADMIGGVSSGGQAVIFSDLYELSSHIKLRTTVNNAISGEGGAEYIITNVNPGNLSTLVGGIWVGANHDLGGGYYAKLLLGDNINLTVLGVVTRAFNPAPSIVDFVDAATGFQVALDMANNDNSPCPVITWTGDVYVGSELVVPRFGVTIKGSGAPHKSRILTFQTGARDSGYIVFKHTDTINCRDFSIVNTGDYIGFGFSTPQDNSSSSQANYCKFNNVQVLGFFNSWWFRSSLWCSWSNCFSHSAAGVRFARNSDPYDRGTDDRNNNWNSFSPLGWFNNMNTFDTCVFEDNEVGIFGATMGTNFHNVTCQNQVGDTLLNEVIPTTESRTGVWLTSGRLGVRDGFNNTFTGTYYAEASDRPLYLQDQATVLIDTVFSQGGSTGDRRDVALQCNNSIVKCGSWTGQDWYTVALILENGSKFYGRVGGVATSTPKTVDSTSLHYEKIEQEIYKHQYSYYSSLADSKLIPLSLSSRSHYRLDVSGLTNGTNPFSASFHVYRHVNDATTSVVALSAVPSTFSVAVTGAKIQITKSNTVSQEFQIFIEECTSSITDTVAIIP